VKPFAELNLQRVAVFKGRDSYQDPASVRDLVVHENDLVVATFGRSFWILDDVTPLRQTARVREAQASHAAYLFRPATAVRVRFATNEPTPATVSAAPARPFLVI